VKKVAKKRRINWKARALFAEEGISGLTDKLVEAYSQQQDWCQRAITAEKHNAILLTCNENSEREGMHWLESYETCRQAHQLRPCPTIWQRFKAWLGL
jgi:hypothetical protein